MTTSPPPAADDNGSPVFHGRDLHYESLAPQYESARHQLYVDLLERAIGDARTRNLALTGAYGTGKSSVLSALQAKHPTAIEISLSTISSTSKTTLSNADNPAAETPTNRIQKEIVKQLLYRLPPSRMPRSKFPRASHSNSRYERLITLGSALAVYAVLLATDLAALIVRLWQPQSWREPLSYVVLFIVVLLVSFLIVRLVQGRLKLESVSAGPATITLSQSSTSFFDQYLDEIVYFFEVSKCDLVIIEDVDRFEDTQIFDTLRALNGLLNTAKQLGRRIVFIYAIRDSVFEFIGNASSDDRPAGGVSLTRSTGPLADRAQAGLQKANRTKFFDVIVPVVPFITHDNARDLMSEVMASTSYKLQRPLISLAARHVADMRLILNIRNEFEVYRNRLMIASKPVPSLTEDLLFAIVLFKNAHMADFEAVRFQASSLDSLFAIERQLVAENLATETRLRNRASSRSSLSQKTVTRAQGLGARLWQYCTALGDGIQRRSGYGTPRLTVTLAGNAADAELMTRPSFWRSLSEGEDLTLEFHDGYNNQVFVVLTPTEVSNIVGTKIEPDEWEELDAGELAEELKAAQSRIEFLRHHTWQELWQRPDFKVADSSSTEAAPLSFADHARNVLPSRLAQDLVKAGFLTHNFALYVSAFYGKHTAPEVMEYITRYVEPGKADPIYELSESDVQQLLEARGAELYEDPSVFNISIVDYLISHRLAAAKQVISRLMPNEEFDRTFIATYAAQGSRLEAFFAVLTPIWPEIFKYIASSDDLQDDRRVPIFDACLKVASSAVKYEYNTSVRDLIEQNYTSLPAIVSPSSAAEAKKAYAIVRGSGAQLSSLKSMNEEGLNAAVATNAYPVTLENLRTLVPESISLDVMRSKRQPVYAVAIRHLDDFLAAFEAAEDVPHTISSASGAELATILEEMNREAPTELIARTLSSSNEQCMISDLADVPESLWPSLAAASRMENSVWNTRTYVTTLGSIDSSLGSFLSHARALTWDDDVEEEDRRELSVRVLNSHAVMPDPQTRVDIATSLEPGLIAAEDLTPDRTNVVALLLQKGLLARDASPFASRLHEDWPSLKAAILVAPNFANLASTENLPAKWLPDFLRSPEIGSDVRLEVLSNLATLVSGASAREAQSIADAINHLGWKIRFARIQILQSLGTSDAAIVAMLGREIDDLSLDQVTSLLSNMDKPYSQISTRGKKRPRLLNSPTHQVILNKLEQGEIVSSVAKEDGGRYLRVNLFH